jgi:hypothetical protein
LAYCTAYTETANTEDPEHPVGAQRAGVTQLLDAAIRRQAGVGERRQLFELQMVVDLDQIASRNGQKLSESAIRPEPRPTHVGTNVRIADLTVPAGAIPPSGRDDHVVPLAEPR